MFTLNYTPNGFSGETIKTFNCEPEQWEIFLAVQDLGYGPEGDGKWILSNPNGYTVSQGYARHSEITVD